MNKLKNVLLLLTLLLFPVVSFASTDTSEFPISVAIFMEAFVTLHMTFGVLMPIANIFDPDKSNNLFIKLFVGRIIILLIFDFLITTYIAIFDGIFVFIGVMFIVPICRVIKKSQFSSTKSTSTYDMPIGSKTSNLLLKCTNCGQNINVKDRFCQNCGEAIEGDNIQVVQDESPIVQVNEIYLKPGKSILKNFIKEEFQNQGENIKNFSTDSVNKKRNVLLGIFGVATFFCMIMFYFNISIKNCLIFEAVALLLYIIIAKSINILNILAKQAIKNPDSDITYMVSDIIMNKKENSVNIVLKTIIVFLIAVIIPTIIFVNPTLLYIKYNDGYAVLRYTRGITYEEVVTVPSTYKDKKVLAIGESAFKNSKVKKVNLPEGIESIRKNAFYGVTEIRDITIPSTVTEISASAFENCSKLVSVNLSEGLKEIRGSAFKNTNIPSIHLPESLEYLGAGAFSHSSLIYIKIPERVTEINGQTFEYCTNLIGIGLHDGITSIHGETFTGCTKLSNITLPKNITEIRGNTFENCKSLSYIHIPHGVTRIGGHAFYGCSSLNYVSVPRTVNEIGSSAFRQCSSLREISIPSSAVVNERAFKESPTRINRY